MNNKSSLYAVCPFYQRNSGKIVYCEGVIGSSEVRIHFDDTANEHLDSFCSNDWKACPVARILWQKYDDVSGMQVFTNILPTRGDLPTYSVRSGTEQRRRKRRKKAALPK